MTRHKESEQDKITPIGAEQITPIGAEQFGSNSKWLRKKSEPKRMAVAIRFGIAAGAVHRAVATVQILGLGPAESVL